VRYAELPRAANAERVRTQLAAALGEGGTAPGQGERAPTLLLVDGTPPALPSVLADRLWPWLTVVVAGTRRLDLPGEHVLPLGPLSENDAVTLFRQRAGQVTGGVGVASDDDQALDALVARLSGSPATIELAARLAVALTPSELLQRFDSAWTLIRAQEASDDGRARRIVDGLEASVAELEPSHRAALGALTVFPGAFGPGDVEAVLGDLRLVAPLVDRSLVEAHRRPNPPGPPSQSPQREAAPDGVPDASPRPGAGGTRYRLPFLVRAFVLETEGEASGEPKHRFVRHTLDVARTLPTGALAERQADLMQAASYVVDEPDLDPGAESFAILARASRWHGAVAAALSIVDAAPPDAWSDPTARCRLGHARATLLAREGQTDAATRAFEEAIREADRGAPSALRVEVRTELANTLRHTGHPDRARTLYRDALAMADGDVDRQARVWAELAALAHERCELTEARACFEAAFGAYDARGLPAELTSARQNYGLVLQEAGDFAAAEDIVRTCLERHRSSGNRRFEGIAEYDLGCLALERRQVHEARTRLERARSIATEVGEHRELGLAEAVLGVALLWSGSPDVDGHFAAAEEALRRASEPGLLRALDVHRTHREVAAIRQAWCDGIPSAAAAERLRAVLEAARSWRRQGDELRYAVRLLEREAATVEEDGALVAADGSWFVVAGEKRVELGARAALRAVLEALVDAYRTDPEVPRSAEALIRSGWPESRSVTASARNRLHVAMTTLRKLGLAEHVVRESEGYRLTRVSIFDPAGS
jgi:tetratricopeptide (TPR) repeat protein